ncbi:MAG: hypothetical protein WEB07_02105 [Natronospirillum sp.]
MKSSSELFPVTLLSAERKEGWDEDTYILKPNNSHDSTVEFALTRFSRRGVKCHASVLWLPHFLTSRLEWLDGWSTALLHMLGRGYDLWFMEWRGHGASGFNANWARNELQDLAYADFPAACDFIIEQSGEAPWIVAERSAAQVWVAAHETPDDQRGPNQRIKGGVLLWPMVGTVSVAQYAHTMGWEDRQLTVSRQQVRRHDHHESINRSLFDQLLLGQPQRLRKWKARRQPAPFCVVEHKTYEKLVHKWLDSHPVAAGTVRLTAPDEVDASLLTRWLEEVSARTSQAANAT